MDVSPPSRPWTSVGRSPLRSVYWCSIDDLYPHLAGLVVQRDVLDLADADAGAAHRRARLDARRVGEADGVFVVRMNRRGKLPKSVMSTASSRKPASTKTPMRKRRALLVHGCILIA